MKFYLNVQIFYFTHKTGFEDLYTVWDFLRGNIFIKDDSFLGRDDRLGSFFLKSLAPSACIGGICARGVCIKGICSESTCTWAASIGSACTRSSCAMGACIEGDCTKDAYIEGTCFRDAGTKDICTEGIYVKGVCIEVWGACGIGICIRSTCVNCVSAVMCSKMHLQSLRILDQNLNIEGICIGGICIMYLCAGNIQIRDAYTCASGACIGHACFY